MKHCNISTQYYIGYSIDEIERYKATSGGIGSCVQKYLLSHNYYGTSITFEFNKYLCMFEPKLIYSHNDINICGSIYQDINIYSFIKANLDKIKRGIVLSCPPCQVIPIRQLLKKNNIPCFIISFCCSGQTTIEGTWKYYELLGVKKEDVVNMQYRGNGWPSGIQIWLKDGTVVRKDNFTEPWVSLHQSKLYAPKRCLYCKLDTGRNADVSLADPWLERYKSSDKIGATMFLPFTEEGMNVISEMHETGLIEYHCSNYDDYAIAQAPNIHKELRQKKYISFIRMHLSLVSKQWYFNWATKNLSHIKMHNKVLRLIYGFYSSDNLKNTFMDLFTKIASHIRFIRIKDKLGKSEGYSNIMGGVILKNPQCIHLGKNVNIGSSVYFGPVINYAGINYNPKIIIGEGSSIGNHGSIAAIDRVEIGKNVLFARYVHITDHSHGYEDISKPISVQPLICKGPVVIEDDCWLGFNCEILSGVHIGKHSIVAARAVVTKNVPPYSIVAGNPARVVKKFNFENQQWERIKE